MMKSQDPGVHRLPESVSPVPSIDQETPTHSQVESSRPDASPSLADEPGVNQPPDPLPTSVRPGIPAVSELLWEDSAHQVHVTWPSPSSHRGWI